MDYKKLKQDSQRLIEVTHTIYNVYDQLINNKINHDIEKYNESLRNLSLAIFVENKIYKEIKERDDDNFTTLFNILPYDVKRQGYDENTSTIITERILNYLDEINFKNKYPYETDDYDEFMEENKSIISLACKNDYTKTLIEELEKVYPNLKKGTVKNQVANLKYTLIFTNKEHESYYLNENRPKRKSQKDGLFTYGHDFYIVKEIYSDYLIDLVRGLLKSLLESNQSTDVRVKDKLNLINLKAAVKIMDLEDLDAIYHQFHSTYCMENDKISIDKLPINNINCINNILEDELTKRIDEIEKEVETNTHKKY